MLPGCQLLRCLERLYHTNKICSKIAAQPRNAPTPASTSSQVVLRQLPNDVQYRVIARGAGAEPAGDAAALADYFNLSHSLAALAPGVKALVGFVGFVVAFISLAALRNFGPVLFYVGLAIFAAVGLVIAGAIMGAVI